MSRRAGYHNRQAVILPKIRSLFLSLDSSTYDEVAPKVEYWIEWALTEHSTIVDELVEEVASVAWGPGHKSHASVARFLESFVKRPRSNQVKSFVDKLCPHVLRWFAVASAERLITTVPGRWDSDYGRVASNGGNGFISAASFVGCLIELGLLSHELVRRFLVKPLIAHHYTENNEKYKSVRTMAIYQLFVTAGNMLLQGLLEPGDVQACFKMFEAKHSLE